MTPARAAAIAAAPLVPLLGIVALGALVEGAGRIGWLPLTVAPPSEVWAAFAARPADLWRHLVPTVSAAAIGFGCAAGAATVLALLAHFIRPLAGAVTTLSVVVYAMPLLALAPILTVWFGTGGTARATIAALAGFYPILVGATQGLRAADPRQHELLHVLAASPWQRFLRLSLPAALPFLFSGLKVSAAGAVLGAIVAEWTGAERGLGIMMAYALFAFRVPQVWLAMAACAACAIAAFALVALVERLVVRWDPPGGRGTMREAIRATGGVAVALLLFLGVWYGAIWAFALPPYMMPTPGDAWRAAGMNAAAIAGNAAFTLQAAGLGLLIALGLALMLAGIFAAFPPVGRAMMPVAVILRSLPVVAVAPLVTLLVGRGFRTSVTVAVIAALFPLLVNAVRGFTSLKPGHLELMHVLAAGRWAVLWRLRLPFALPHLFAGLRTAAPVSVLGAMLAEWLTGSRGLGYLILDSAAMRENEMLWAAICTSMLLALLVFGATALAEARARRWLG